MARYQEDLEWVKSLCLGRHVLWKLLDITDTWSCLCPLVDRSQRNDYSLAMKCAHRIYSLRDGVCCFRFWFSVPCYFVFFSEQQEGHLPEILRHFWDCLQNGKTTRGARARAQVGTPRGGLFETDLQYDSYPLSGKGPNHPTSTNQLSKQNPSMFPATVPDPPFDPSPIRGQRERPAPPRPVVSGEPGPCQRAGPELLGPREALRPGNLRARPSPAPSLGRPDPFLWLAARWLRHGCVGLLRGGEHQRGGTGPYKNGQGL